MIPRQFTNWVISPSTLKLNCIITTFEGIQRGVSRLCQGFCELDYFCTIFSTEGVEP